MNRETRPCRLVTLHKSGFGTHCRQTGLMRYREAEELLITRKDDAGVKCTPIIMWPLDLESPRHGEANEFAAVVRPSL